MSIQCWKTVWFYLVLASVIGLASAFGETPPPNSPSPDSTVFEVIMEKRSNTLPGHYAPLSIRLRSGQDRINGFSFLIAFDSANIRLNRAEPGDFLIAHGWANFSVEPVPSEPGDTSAPIGLLRITASVGAGVPPDTSKRHADDLVRLVYIVDTVHILECQFLPMRFFWRSCEDNLISSGSSGNPFYVQRVIEQKSTWKETNGDCLLPARDAAILPARCQSEEIHSSRQVVIFINGGIEMYCIYYAHPVGDLDLNGIICEPDDIDALARLLVHGCLCGYNTDSLQYLVESTPNLSYGDKEISVKSLAFLNRLMIGDAQRNLSPINDSVILATGITNDSLTLTCRSSTPLGCVLLTFETDDKDTIPMTSGRAFGRQIAYAAYDGRVCLIVYDIGRESIPAGQQELGSLYLPGLVRLTAAEAADYFGRPVKVLIQ